MRNAFASPEMLLEALKSAWSLDSSSSWTKDNPAKGQCSVTALVVQDLFGGEIFTTKTKGGTHFYNLIDGTRYDLTISQFDYEISFDDMLSERDEAFADTSLEQYQALMTSLDLYAAR
jgi:hypothetical protein